MNAKKFPLLSGIRSPDDLKILPESKLTELADELRNFLVETLDQCGGHFGANLGAIEITIALHYLLNTPDDNIIWDVGHQAYPHKILTGRAEQLKTVKQHRGLAPFPARDESPYDVFGVGHSSTSISAGIGMSLADSLNNKQRTTNNHRTTNNQRQCTQQHADDFGWQESQRCKSLKVVNLEPK